MPQIRTYCVYGKTKSSQTACVCPADSMTAFGIYVDVFAGIFQHAVDTTHGQIFVVTFIKNIICSFSVWAQTADYVKKFFDCEMSGTYRSLWVLV